MGLFQYSAWMEMFAENNLTVHEKDMDHLYDKYLINDRPYKLKVFICKLL